ncbi:non-hydrolyzing UDP-N-acetylglucosamine 2-epimerase [Paenibacillus chungangensis]|uniref:Non-hydrolyzing UDP-N-acetylglucosamine 2-epimerase n=1 Tax=Paenibacillus chungangensis TaxID=696535 RepID=A0ABW3HL95_9BACL
MKIASIVGARPQFIKAACLSKALRAAGEEVLIHTGQHYDRALSSVIFQQLDIPEPDYRLGAGSDTHARQTARMLEGIEAVLIKERPQLAVVFGDTNSTLAASLAAAKLRIPVAHVEAGLRSYNKQMPEEINRIVTDHLSALLFCPSDNAVNHLAREGIVDGVYQVGDLMYDCVLAFRSTALAQSRVLQELEVQPRQYALATVHRAENTDNREKLLAILSALANLGTTVVLPLHPRTLSYIKKWRLQHYLASPALQVCSPLPYLDMLCLLHHAEAVLTDSGGLQKEAYMMQVPCVTLRGETEWGETVLTGWNKLAPPHSIPSIVSAFESIEIPDSCPPLFGDGQTAHAIVRHIKEYLLGTRA